MTSPGATAGPLALVEWRGRVEELYARIRRGIDAGDATGAHDDWRRSRDGLFATHPESPLEPAVRDGFPGLPVARYNPAFAFTGEVDTDVEQERFPVGTSGGGTIDFVRVGRVAFALGALDLFWLDAYGGGLFLPFRDGTSGDSTYGGGRYLLDTAKGSVLGMDGPRLRLDFNFAYHPSCHYAPTWNCPLAPPANWLAAELPVGEQAGSA